MATSVVVTLLVLAVAAGPGQAALRSVGLLDGAPPRAVSPPANDAFVAAEPVSGVDISGTTVDATADPDEIAAGIADAGQHVVWYQWSPIGHGWAYVTPALAGDARPQPTVRVYEGTAIDALTQVDAPASGGGTAGVSVPAVAGRTYALAVVHADGGSPFDLRVLQPDAGTRPNDEPIGAVDVGAGVLDASTASAPRPLALDTLGGATAATSEPPTGGRPAEHSVWFVWHAPPGGGTLELGVQPAYGDPGPYRVAAWTGTSIGDLALVTGGGDSLDLDAVGGTRYLLSVDGPEGWFELTAATSGVAGKDTAAPEVTCGPPPVPWSTGQVVIACTATDAGSGLADPTDASFTLEVAAPDKAETDDASTASRSVCDQSGNCATAGPISGIRIDRRAPQVTCDQVPPGWTLDNPTVTCRAIDGGSGLADPADAERSVSPTVPDGSAGPVALASSAVCDAAGNCTPPQSLGTAFVDRQPPTITCDPLPPGPRRDNATVTCRAAEGTGSGLADPALASFTLATSVVEGQADLAAVTGTTDVCDEAGNCATAGPLGPVAIDRAAPEVRCDAPTGWSTAAVAIPCTVSDEGTGLSPTTPDPLVLVAELPEGSESASVASTQASVCDQVGNCTDAGPVSVPIDRKAPVVACDAPPDGWSAGPVVVRCGATDEGSGLADPATTVVTLQADAPPDTETTLSTGSLSVCDAAGNCSTAGPVTGIRIDTRPPVVTCDAVPTGVVRTEATVRCRAADEASGLFDPTDGEFSLVTAVGPGNADPAAPTDSREVCDVAGNCTRAGPFTAEVDRTVDPEPGPPLATPERVTVLAAVDPVVPVPVPFTMPAAPGLDIACQPAPGTPLHEGWTVVVCEGVDADGVSSLGSFRLVVKPMVDLAARGPAVAGGAWRAVGVGFAPQDEVRLELDGRLVETIRAGDDGRVSIPLLVPSATPPGSHLVVLRGTDPGGDELLVVTPVTVEVADAGTPPPTPPPPGAPTLPVTGPTVPPDPSPTPALPQLYAPEVPPSVTSTTTTTTPPSSVPGSSTSGPPASGATTSGLPGASSITTPGPPATPEADDGGITGTLPTTGAAIGLLVLIALILLAVGRTLLAARDGADRRRR